MSQYPIADFPFSEVFFKIGQIHTAPVDGLAHIDEDGNITHLEIDGWKDGKAFTAGFTVPLTHQRIGLFEESWLVILAARIEEDYSHIIGDKLSEYYDSAGRKETTLSIEHGTHWGQP